MLWTKTASLYLKAGWSEYPPGNALELLWQSFLLQNPSFFLKRVIKLYSLIRFSLLSPCLLPGPWSHVSAYGPLPFSPPSFLSYHHLGTEQRRDTWLFSCLVPSDLSLHVPVIYLCDHHVRPLTQPIIETMGFLVPQSPCCPLKKLCCFPSSPSPIAYGTSFLSSTRTYFLEIKIHIFIFRVAWN